MAYSLQFRGFNYTSYYNGAYENADSLTALAGTNANTAALNIEYGIDVAMDAIWSRLLDRALPRPGITLTDEPDLHLLVDGCRADGVMRPDGTVGFRLVRPPATVRIVSRAGVPQELGLARDPRIVVLQGRRLRLIDADDAALVDGFHGFEPDNGFRWTDGDAALPASLFAGLAGVVELVLHVACTSRYLADGRERQAA
jgi:hypothetical protein